MDNINNMDNINDRIIYVFWTGDNKLSENRKNSLAQLKIVTECKIILVTTDNLNDYILKDHPLHEAYKYLSHMHKADYLRTYFMNFYGGGYSDIKKTPGSWKNAFNDLNKSNKWINGYKEIGPHGIAYHPVSHSWQKLIGNGAYICKPKTKLTIEWYNELLLLLDTKLEKLKLYPSTFPRESSEYSKNNYPIEWNEMLGRIFHKVSYKYIDKILNTLPAPICYNYI